MQNFMLVSPNAVLLGYSHTISLASSDSGWEGLPPILSSVSIGLNEEGNYYDDATKSRITAELTQRLSTGIKWFGSPPAAKRITGDGDDYIQFNSQIIQTSEKDLK